MGKGIFKIGAPYKLSEESTVKFCADIDNDGRMFTMHFDFPEEYDEYIEAGNVDPFVLMSIEYCMAKQLDIVSEEPMTEDLFYKMNELFIPILADNTETFYPISIKTPTIPAPAKKGKAVATGMSCGVDSLNVALRYKDYPIKKYRLTHAVFINNGGLGKTDYDETKRVFEIEKEHARKCTDELGLEFLPVNTNMVELYSEIADHRANNNEGLKIAAVLYCVRTLFSIYFIASSFALDLFKFSDFDVGFFAFFTAETMSSDIEFIIGDQRDVERMDKVMNIADSPISQKYLHVNPVENPTRGLKVDRTMTELWILDKLDKYRDVFDVDSYMKHINRRQVIYFSQPKDWEFGYAQEIIRYAKKEGKPIKKWILAAAHVRKLLKIMKGKVVK